jgi:hypothetical protein
MRGVGMVRNPNDTLERTRSTDKEIARIIEQGEVGAGAAMRALEALEPSYYAAASAGIASQTVTYSTSTAA